jgi:hypothetical protein
MAHKQMIRIAIIAVAVIFILYIVEPDFIMFDVPPHIRNLLWIIFIITGAILLATYLRPMKPPRPPGMPMGEGQQIAKTVSGIVIDYGSNKVGDIDKILLQQADKKIWLHFPPHTASQIMSVGAKNATVNAEVGAMNKMMPDNVPMSDLTSIQSAALGKTVFIHDIPPPPPSRGDEIEVKGSAAKFKLDDNGKVSAFILADKIIELHPGMIETLVPLLQQAKEIIVKGYERGMGNGFVNVTGFPLVKPYNITIDKINYVVQ